MMENSLMAKDILIVDDEKDIRSLVADILGDEGYSVRVAATGEKALEELYARQPHALILDVWLGDPQFDDLKLLEKIKKTHPHIPVVIMSGHGNIETAVKAIQLGANDFLEKPFKTEKLLHVLSKVLEMADLRAENQSLKSRLVQSTEIKGRSTAIQNILKTIHKVAPVNSRVLITGASGVGKEMVAREIHQHSARSKAPFVVAQCRGLQSDEIKKMLFGSGDGETIQTGLIENVHQGTLYIDELTVLPLDAQSILLSYLHDGTFVRMGGKTKVSVDVRILAGSSHDLHEKILEKSLREDLFYRLNVVPIHIPSLRERRDDIPLLLNYFMSSLASTNGVKAREFSEPALALLGAYAWPGNIDELKNVVERLLIVSAPANDEQISINDLPPEIRTGKVEVSSHVSQNYLDLPLRDAREHFEREYLFAQVSKFAGNISRTAHFIGMERSALHRKMRTLEVSSSKKNVG